MGGGGGNPIVNAVSTVATAFAAPVVGAVQLAKGADEAINDGKITEKVDALPVVGTLSQGVTASGELYGDVATGVVTGDFSEFRKDAVPAAKMGVVVAGAYAGGATALGGSAGTGVVAGATIGERVAQQGISVGSLTGGAAAFLGTDLGTGVPGFDYRNFLPKPGPVERPSGGFDMGGGGDYFVMPKSVTGSGVTFGLGIAAVVIFILVMRRKK